MVVIFSAVFDFVFALVVATTGWPLVGAVLGELDAVLLHP